jgi:hypothetical protein
MLQRTQYSLNFIKNLKPKKTKEKEKEVREYRYVLYLKEWERGQILRLRRFPGIARSFLGYRKICLVKVRRLELEELSWKLDQWRHWACICAEFRILVLVFRGGGVIWWNFSVDVGATLYRNFDVNIKRAAWKECCATWNLVANLEPSLWLRKTTENLDPVGRSQDLPDTYLLPAISPAFKHPSPDCSPYLCCCFIWY